MQNIIEVSAVASNDVFVVIGGQQFRIAGDTLLPMQNSFQQEVLKRFDGIDSRLDGIESRLDKVESRLDKVETRLGKVESRLGAVETSQLHMNDRIDWVQTTIYWGFALMGVIAAVYTLWLSTPKGSKQNNTPPASQPIIVQLPPYPYHQEREKQSA